jgi:hypothetical protein
MSRWKIAAVVAVVVSGLTAVAYSLTTSKIEKKIKDDVRTQVVRARDLLVQNATFEALDLIKRAEQFARTPGFAGALGQADRKMQELSGAQAIREAVQNLKEEDPRPDFVALVHKDGTMVAIDPAANVPTDWKARYQAVTSALDHKRASKDVWAWEQTVMKVGVSPVVDRATNEILGAVVAAYPLDAAEAQNQAKLLGMHVAYFFGDKVRATSFGKTGSAQDESIGKLLFEGGLAKSALDQRASEVVEVKLGDEPYMASAASLPLNLSDKTSGAVVLMSLAGALEPLESIKTAILLLGIAGLVISILAIFLTARLILAPAEEIELGVAEIINGNIDYQFRPVGADFDGLANALNVMLARFLGRAEPGEEEYDDQGNVVGGTSKVVMGDAEPPTPADQAAMQLANEPEADYYRRLFNEYVDAKKSLGEKMEGMAFDAFMAKLRMNEASLRKKYAAKSVRFKVQIKDGQVTLKPVPIL